MRKGGRSSKGWAVVNRPGTRVDGYFTVFAPRARKLVLQVSKIKGSQGERGWVGTNIT